MQVDKIIISMNAFSTKMLQLYYAWREHFLC